MAAGQLLGMVFVAVVQHRTVVAGQDNDRVVGQSLAAQGFSEPADRIVELQDSLSAQAHRTLAPKPLVRHTRHVDIVCTEIEEEGAAGVLMDKAHGMGRDGVGNVLIAPQGLAPTPHVADAPYTVHDAHVVSVAGTLLGQQLGIVAPGRLSGKVLAVAHADGRSRVAMGHLAVLNIDTRHAVGGGCHDVMVVEAQVGGRLVETTVPVLFAAAAAQAQVPLAEGCRAVAGCLEHVGHGVAFGRYDHAGIACRHVSTLPAQRVFAGQDAIARRGAGGRTGVGVGEAYARTGQTVDGWRADPLGAVARQVAIAQVIGQDQDYIGTLRLGWRGDSARCPGCQDEGASFHNRGCWLSANVALFPKQESVQATSPRGEVA